MSAAPSEKSPVEPRDWSRAEVKDGVCTIILILTKVEQLFDTDVPVPSEFVALDSDVLDFFTSTIKKHHKACREFRLIVRLPEQALREVEPYMRTSVDLTLKGYFLAREKRIAERLHEHFQDAWKMFGFGFAFMLACTLLRTYLAPEEVHSLMSSFREGLLVIGWVALWKPVEELLFNWWTLKRELVSWHKLAKMEMKVETF